MGHSALAPFAHRDYRLAWAGFFLSSFGSQMQFFGLAWFLVQFAAASGTPHLAPLYLGLLAATRAVPTLVIGVIAGAISDRMDRRRLLMFSSLAGGAIAVVFAVIVLTGFASLPVILLLSTLAAAAQSFEPVTRMAMVGRLVPRPIITSAIGSMLTTGTLGTLLGPLGGGLLIGPVGVGGLLAVNAATFVPIVIALVAMRPAPLQEAPRSGFVASIADGLLYVWRHPVLRPIFALTGVTALAGRPVQQLLPAFSTEILGVGAVELSWLLAAIGAGSLAGSLVIATAGGSAPRGRLLGLSAIAYGALIVVFTLQREMLFAFATVALLSIAASVQVGLHIATYQAAAPEDVRGRVTAVSASLVNSAMAVGALGLGVIASLLRIDFALAMGGVVIVLAGIATLRSSALRAWRGEVAPIAVASSR